MTPDRWRRVRELFAAAVLLDHPARRAFLDQHCADDPALRHEVASLLAHDEPGTGHGAAGIDPLGEVVGAAAREIVDPDRPPATLTVGQRIGPIRVEAFLGRGGMGEVYVGFDERLERSVALKTLRLRDRLTTRSRVRFRREARMLSRLDHPNICRIFEYVEGDDTDYLVLELIRGHTLAAALEQGMTTVARMKVATQVADVLTAAHGQGIVHRDLKPHNVMITDGGETKVLDFGLARDEGRAVSPAPEDRTAPAATSTTAVADGSRGLSTRDSQILGTPIYMSPEQARGEAVTSASDLYTFGLLLQRMFTGRGPYPAHLDADGILDHARRGDTLPITGVDPDLRRLIEHLKSPAPADRPTARAARQRLHWIAGMSARRWRRGLVAAVLALIIGMAVKYTFDLETERDRAERRRAQAEDLIGFMIGDLRSKLAPVNRLEVLDEIGDKAQAYFAALPAQESSAEELLFRSRTLSQIGQVRMEQGDLAAALAAFEESRALADDLVGRAPADAAALAWLGTTHFWVGNVAWLRQATADALVSFRAYLEVSRTLVDREPDNLDWQLELSYAHNNIGSVLAARGRTDEAIDAFRASLATKQRLVAARPSDETWQRDLAGTHSWLAEAWFAEGDLDAAHRHFEANRSILNGLIENDPAHIHHRFLLGIAHEKLGFVREPQGHPDEARAHFETCRAIFAALTAEDPDRAGWRRELGVAHLRLGQVALRLEDVARAAPHLARAEAIFDALIADDPSNGNWRRQWAAGRIAIGQLEMYQGDPAAGATLRAALETLDTASGEEDGARRRLRAEAHLTLGDLWMRAGDDRRSSDAYARALALLGPATPTADQAGHPLDRALRVLALSGQGDRARAGPIAMGLYRGGFRRVDFVRRCRTAGLDLDPPTH